MIPLPEPSQFAPQMITEDAYTRDQMIEFGRACAAAERERCARLFDLPAHIHGEAEVWSRIAAAAIRELKDE